MAYIGRDIQYGILDKQTLTGANGSKTQWTDLTYGVGSASSLLVSVGGVIQEPDVAYTASGNVLNFTEAPETGDTVFVVYLGKELSVATAQSDLAYQTGTGDDTVTPITTLNRSVPAAEDIMVMLNGVTQVPGTDYNVSGTTLTFTTAPVAGMNILVYFLGIAANIGTPSDGTVTTAKIVDANVTTAKIADANVTTAKIASDAITTAKIADSTVTNAKVASNAGIDYSKLSLGNASRASLSADQTLTTGTTTKMQFNTEDYDVGGDYDASTNYRYTVGSGDAGKYLIYAALNAAPSDAKRIRVYLYKNGSQLDPPGYQSNNQSVAGNFLSVTTFAILELADADYIEIYGSHNEGGNLVVQSEYSSFIVARLD